jgi:hypothetical protein
LSQLVDYRVEFSKWWIAEFKTIKYPSQGTVFDYFIHPETKQFTPWSEKIPKFELDPDIPLQVRVSTPYVVASGIAVKARDSGIESHSCLLRELLRLFLWGLSQLFETDFMSAD